MFDFWETELTEEETRTLLDQAETEIRKRQLMLPAVLALEMHKPLANLGAQAALVSAPFLVPFLGFNFVNNYSRLLLKKENIDELIDRLEKRPVEAPRLPEDSCAI